MKYIFHPSTYHQTSHPTPSLCPDLPAIPSVSCCMHRIASTIGLHPNYPSTIPVALTYIIFCVDTATLLGLWDSEDKSIIILQNVSNGLPVDIV